METMIKRGDFIRRNKCHAHTEHTVTIAIKQLNLHLLEESALSRNTPGSDNYQQWLTHEEVNAIRQNTKGFTIVREWLRSNQVNITWVSSCRLYVKAVASMLNTSFFLYEDQKLESQHRFLPRAQEYSLPEHLIAHITAIFEVAQLPPVIVKTGQHIEATPPSTTASTTTNTINNLRNTNNNTQPNKRQLAQACSRGYTDVQCLNSVYDIGTNIGHPSTTQSVFETLSQVLFITVIYTSIT